MSSENIWQQHKSPDWEIVESRLAAKRASFQQRERVVKPLGSSAIGEVNMSAFELCLREADSTVIAGLYETAVVAEDPIKTGMRRSLVNEIIRRSEVIEERKLLEMSYSVDPIDDSSWQVFGKTYITNL